MAGLRSRILRSSSAQVAFTKRVKRRQHVVTMGDHCLQGLQVAPYLQVAILTVGASFFDLSQSDDLMRRMYSQPMSNSYHLLDSRADEA